MAADISPFIKDAQRLERETGIPTSITLGQIILESSGRFAGGLSGLAASAKNLFGVKGTGNAGSVLMPTSEQDANGNPRVIQAQFKKYDSYYDSLVDHAKVLSKPRYQKYLASAMTVNEYAAGIKAGGYATDTKYVSKLLGVIQSNKLTGYDVGGKGFTPITSGSQEVGGVPSEQTNNTGVPTEQVAKNNTIESVYFHTVRVVVLVIMFILLIVFFLKAFPAVDDVVSTVAPSPTKPLKMIKSVTKTVKAAKGVKK